jgi:hypothetical protein
LAADVRLHEDTTARGVVLGFGGQTDFAKLYFSTFAGECQVNYSNETVIFFGLKSREPKKAAISSQLP